MDNDKVIVKVTWYRSDRHPIILGESAKNIWAIIGTKSGHKIETNVIVNPDGKAFIDDYEKDISNKILWWCELPEAP